MVGANFSFMPDHYLQDGEILELCGSNVKCIKTPGHTCGGMCYYIEDKYWLIAGDTLFQGSIGRTDFPTGSYGELSASIKEKIYTLPDWTKVFPGHGESTTVGEEKVSNMFVHL
jgi:glyoxylase-like metal-dependent hydrolase (beta-lactamase superfamily II)